MAVPTLSLSGFTSISWSSPSSDVFTPNAAMYPSQRKWTALSDPSDLSSGVGRYTGTTCPAVRTPSSSSGSMISQRTMREVAAPSGPSERPLASASLTTLAW